MSEFHANIWDLVAFKIAKRLSKEKRVPMTIGLVRDIADELRIFNESLVVKIYFRLPDAKEITKIETEMVNLAMSGE